MGCRKTCSGAARNGHLDCLKYVRENGCSWGVEKHVVVLQGMDI